MFGQSWCQVEGTKSGAQEFVNLGEEYISRIHRVREKIVYVQRINARVYRRIKKYVSVRQAAVNDAKMENSN